MRWALPASILLAVAACKGSDAPENASASQDLNAVNVAEEASARPKVLCGVIGERVSREQCDDTEALTRDVRPGAAALDVPDPMFRGQPSQVTLVIDRRPLREIHQRDAANKRATAEPSSPSASQANQLSSDASESGTTNAGVENGADNQVEGTGGDTPNQVVAALPGNDYSFPSNVGRYMKASLAGNGFDVRLVSPENALQEIPPGGQGAWIWQVTPEQEGPHSLIATTEAVAVISGRPKPLSNAETVKTVNVEVRRADRVRDFLNGLPDWLKLIAGVLAAAAVVVGAWVRLRKSIQD